MNTLRKDGTIHGDGSQYNGIRNGHLGGGRDFSIATFIEIEGELNNTSWATIETASITYELSRAIENLVNQILVGKMLKVSKYENSIGDNVISDSPHICGSRLKENRLKEAC